MLRKFIKFLELFYFSIYSWLRRNTSNWDSGPALISSGLIYFCLIGNFGFLYLKNGLPHYFLIVSLLISFLFYLYLTFHYDDDDYERFELIEYRFEQLSKLEKIIIKNLTFFYIVYSLYSWYSVISLKS